MLEYTNTGDKDTRSGFGAGLSQAAKENENVVALCADLTGSVKMDAFAKDHPERFIQTGIAEANMVGVAAGLATAGKVPFVGTFAEFASGRVYDQIRQSVAYSGKNVKIAASHAGITLGEDGATHQTMEDIALMRAMPNMAVLVPADYNQTKAATIAAAQHDGPVYLRFGRPKVPNFTPADMPFEIGKAWTLQEGRDVTIFATGHMLWKALEAAKTLAGKGIEAEVVNIHTIKPLDTEAIVRSVARTGAAVTAEEHLMNGGMGDAVAQTLARRQPAPVEFVAMDDCFGESGTPDQLLEKYGLTAQAIVEAAERAVERKQK